MINKHIFGIEDLDREDIIKIFEYAEEYHKYIQKRPVKTYDFLDGFTVLNLFFEPSTRTRISFEIAAQRLGANVVNFSKTGSSVAKGETLRDTILSLDAMKPDLIVVRNSEPFTPKFVSENSEACVINAGDGTHEHPTQALLDTFTMSQYKDTFEGLKVAIVGDILHSRVARSNILALNKLGAKVVLVGPPTLVPEAFTHMGVEVCYDFDKIIPDMDVIMMLRIQLERQKSGLFPSISEYHKLYALTEERIKRVKKDVLIMHPGPINRGVEFDGIVADGENSLILEQVANGVVIRMALLTILLRGDIDAKDIN